MVLPLEISPPTSSVRVVRYAESSIPTARGRMRFLVYRQVPDGRAEPAPIPEHVAMVLGDASRDPGDVLVRVHSECMTSEVFGSLKCDCREQLDTALDLIAEAGRGMFIYLRQEGRGIGLGNKIRAYALQERGADTIEANHQLGFATDERSYDVAAAILRDLGVRAVRLLTNNPGKVQGLESGGIEVLERLAVQIPPTLHSASYLRVKRERMGHLLDRSDDGE